MKKIKNKKSLIAIIFLSLFLLVGGTIAYYTSQDIFNNLFSAATYRVITTETFVSPDNWKPGDVTPKVVTTKNEGSIPVHVRVKLEQKWTSANGNELSLDPAPCYSGVAIIDYDDNHWLFKDGYYYYIDELAPGEETVPIINSVTFCPNISANITCTTEGNTKTCESSGNGYDDATYELNVTVDTVQADQYQMVWTDTTLPILYDYEGANPCTFEGEMVAGAEYYNGPYVYRYMYETNDVGWSVQYDNYGYENDSYVMCSSVNHKPIVSMNNMFFRKSPTSYDWSSLDTSNVTDMSYMFNEYSGEEVDFSHFNTSKVTNMKGMFAFSYVDSIDLSGLDTENVTDMEEMFRYAEATTIDISSLNTGNVTSMRYMFASSHADELDFSHFDTSKVTDMDFMFLNCETDTLDLSSFNTSRVETMDEMFFNSKATTIDVSSFNTTKVYDMKAMFGNTHVDILDLSSFDMITYSHETNQMFTGSVATVGYARTQADANVFNNTTLKPSGLTFVIKNN